VFARRLPTRCDECELALRVLLVCVEQAETASVAVVVPLPCSRAQRQDPEQKRWWKVDVKLEAGTIRLTAHPCPCTSTPGGSRCRRDSTFLKWFVASLFSKENELFISSKDDLGLNLVDLDFVGGGGLLLGEDSRARAMVGVWVGGGIIVLVTVFDLFGDEITESGAFRS
jgi:hypothetical protein